MKKVIRIKFVFISLFSILVCVRFYHFVNKYALNVLFWDQWDFYQPLFENKNFIDKFTYEHGPHRQGLGLFFVEMVNSLRAWNSRTLSLALVFTTFITVLLAFVLKYKFIRKFDWTDMLLSVPFCSFLTYETYIGAANPSHGVLPVLLMFLILLAFFISHIYLRYFIIAVLNFLLVFTGFGIFSGLVVLLLGIFELLINLRKKTPVLPEIFLILTSLLTIGVFFVDYKIQTASSCFVFPDPNPFKYLQFLFIQFSTAFGLFGKHSVQQVFGAFLVLFLMYNLYKIAVQRLKVENQSNRLLFSAFAYSLLFALAFSFNTAVGRVCYGLSAALSSRYAIYFIPLLVASYILIRRNYSQRRANFISLILLTLFVFREFKVYKNLKDENLWQATEARQAWAKCYLSKHNIVICDSEGKARLYPASSLIQSRLDFLEKNRLNFFNSDGP